MSLTNKAIYITTPSFNAATTIEQTILSVITQAGEFVIHYHVQDGGSTDGTLAILQRWKGYLDAGTFPVQCAGINFSFANEPDSGMYDALVKGFAKFTIPDSAFMTWINADDVLMPGALALISAVADSFNNEQVSWLSGLATIIKNERIIATLERPTTTLAIREGMCDGKHWHFVQQEGTFFRKWLWNAANPETALKKYKLAGDWNLWRLFAHHANYIQIPWSIGAFRLRVGQLSQANGPAYMAEIEATVTTQTRLEALRTLGDSGAATKFMLKTQYPSGKLSVVEKSADGQTHFYYHKNFGCWPARPLDDKTAQAERLVYEANSEPKNVDITPKVSVAKPKEQAATVKANITEALLPKPEFFDNYTYARRSHWQFFDGIDAELFGEKKNIRESQLKVYQDLLVLRFIRDNVAPGSRILDVGGGISRILSHLSKTYECWNIDKLEGVGNGPRAVKEPPYRLVRDYMGNFNPELPDGYFDLVFSISALEHVPQNDTAVFDNIIKDIDRVLKPGGLSLHLFDIILKPNAFWTNKFTNYIFDNVKTLNKTATPAQMRQDPDFYAMSEEAYNKTWLHSTKKPFHEHGLPSSLNILWQKNGGQVQAPKLTKPAKIELTAQEPNPAHPKKTETTVVAAHPPTIFVVTPCLNDAATIERTIQSVIGQSGAFRIRYHVQDGGSTDGTVEKLRQLSLMLDSANTLIKCQGIEFTWASAPNHGMYESLAEGFDSMATSPEDILAWIKGSDVFMPDAFATVARIFATQPALQWLGGSKRMIDGSDLLLEESDIPVPNQVIREGLCDGQHWPYLQQAGIFFKKSLWFKSKHALHGFRLAGDWSLWREFARQAAYLQIEQPLGALRKNPVHMRPAHTAEYDAEIATTLQLNNVA